MINWFVDKEDIKNKTINAIMSHLESVITDGKTANFWIDSFHNVFAFVNDNGNNDRWIEIHYELYDFNEDIIGDLLVLNTEDISLEDLLKEIKIIVNEYYGD